MSIASAAPAEPAAAAPPSPSSPPPTEERRGDREADRPDHPLDGRAAGRAGGRGASATAARPWWSPWPRPLGSCTAGGQRGTGRAPRRCPLTPTGKAGASRRGRRWASAGLPVAAGASEGLNRSRSARAFCNCWTLLLSQVERCGPVPACHSNAISIRNSPIFSAVAITLSPGLRNSPRGYPTPAGEPVRTTSPGSSVTNRLIELNCSSIR